MKTLRQLAKLTNRRSFLKAAGLALAFAAMPKHLKGKGKSKPSKPNILIILTDDQGYGDLSCYGAEDMKTPNLDGLVAEGMRFNSFYANCPVCSPTRASILTGRYPDMVGVPGVIRTNPVNSFGYLSPQAVMLPSILKKAGYNTAIIGKWHLGLDSPNTPNERGFDYFKGFLGDMMNDYYNHRRHGINYMRQDDKEIDPPGHATDLFSSWAVDYIQSRSGAKKPFFLYLAYNAPHVPVQPPDDWLRRVNARQKNIDQTRAKLVAFIEHLDYGIGRVISALRETNAYDNTLIIFTSDNGGQLNVGANNGPFTGSKQQMFEGGICVSFAAVWPGKIKPASSSETVALTMDIFPTVCEAAGAAFSHEIDGRSFLQTLLGKSQPEQERFLFWVRREGNEKSPQPYYKGGRAYYAARYGRWKLLQNNPFEPLRLYDLKADPKEQNPLSQEHPAYKKLVVALKKHIIKAGAVPWQKYPVELPPDNWNK